jgi:hypothetical protein
LFPPPGPDADKRQVLDAPIALENFVRDAGQAARHAVGIHYDRHTCLILDCGECVQT